VPEEPDFGSLKPGANSTQGTSGSKPDETEIKLTPPLLEGQKDKPSANEPEANKSAPDGASNKSDSTEKPGGSDAPSGATSRDPEGGS
jgi:hypothetical protein